jgi:hypothetical protein
MTKTLSITSIALLSLLLAVGCGGERKSASTDSGSAGASSIGEYNGKPLEQIPVVATFKYPDDFVITTTRKQIVQKWGEPKDVVTEKVTSPYDKNTEDTRYTLKYDGFSFLFYYSAAKKQELLVATTITSPSYAVSDGLRVGMFKSVMLAKFGEPTFVEKSSYVYTAGMGSEPQSRSPNQMNKELTITDNRISKIVIYPEIP